MLPAFLQLNVHLQRRLAILLHQQVVFGDALVAFGSDDDAVSLTSLQGLVELEIALAVGQADAQGYFQLDQALERGESYSIIIGARGYKRIAEDDLLVEEDTESPLEIDVELEKGR